MDINQYVNLFNTIDPSEYMGLKIPTKSIHKENADANKCWAVIMPENHDHFFNGKAYGIYKNPIAIFREKALADKLANEGNFEVIEI